MRAAEPLYSIRAAIFERFGAPLSSSQRRGIFGFGHAHGASRIDRPTELPHELKYCEIDPRMIKLLLTACACVQSFVLRPPLPQRTPALRAVDDEMPPESDAEAERIAEMRARMEAMFGGGGEAPAAEPPAPEPPAAEAPPAPAPPVAADDDEDAMRARMEALFGGGSDSPAAEAEAPPADEPSADETKKRGLFGRRKKSRAPEEPTDDLGEELSKLRETRGTPEAREPSMPASDLPDGLQEALNPKGGAGEARPAVPDGVALDLAEAARHACDATVAAVLEGKRKVLIEARVEGLDPAQETIDGSAVLAWAKNALSRLPYDNLVLLDAAGTTRLAEEDGITAEPLLLNFGQANEEETPDSTLYVVFAPFSNDDMVATRRVFRAASFKNLPVVVLNHRHDEPGGAEPPREYFDATEAYCLRPLMVRGGTPPVRVVVSRRYPAPYEIFVDIGKGAYRRHAEFDERPTAMELQNVIRAAIDRGGPPSDVDRGGPSDVRDFG